MIEEKIMKKNIFITAFIALFLAVGCTDEDSFKNEVFFKLERGGLVRFVEAFSPLIGTEQPTSWTYDKTVWDANGNLDRYDVSVIGGDKDGDGVTDTTVVNSITDFGGAEGVSINITSDAVAAALGVATGDLAFGQSFDFIAVAVRKDGVVFTAEELVADFDNNVFSGNTQENLIAEPGYANAMSFSLTIACPSPPSAANYPGTYTVNSSTWFAAGQTVTVVEGAGENEIIIQGLVGRAGLGDGTGDFTITLNQDQTLSYGAQSGTWAHPTFGPITYLQGASGNFTFECANNTIVIRHEVTVAAGSFGNSTTTLSR